MTKRKELICAADRLRSVSSRFVHLAALLDSVAQQLAEATVICEAARRCVRNPKWAGVCDEDVALEKALADAGWLADDGEDTKP